MRINVHAHIFNLQTVLTQEAVVIMARRLRERRWPDFVVEAAEEFLDAQLNHPEYLVEEDLLRRFVQAIGRNPKFRNWLAATSAPVELRILGDAPTELAVDTLRSALGKLSSYIDTRDATGSNLLDLFETLLVAMQPEIVDVADRLLSQMRPDDALVALMMDIVGESEKPRDRRNFLAQLKGTGQAAVLRPGRILPFIAVNPARTDHYEVMVRAIEELGFVGVKLYPALGYDVKSDAMRRVIAYCARPDRDIPITMHCTSGGFSKSATASGYCHPKHWKTLFEDHPTVRVCFAHCGGWGGLSHQDAAQAEWADHILGYMEEHPNVYADLSYHVEMMSGGAKEAAYLARLKELLADDTCRDRILFGTDSWLVRMNLTEEAYWRYFESTLTPPEFAQIAEANPRAFLGLPGPNGEPPRGNIVNHLAFLRRHRERVGQMPSPWVLAALPGVDFAPSRVDPRWSPNNRAHVATYRYLRWEANTIPAQYHSLQFEGSGKLRLYQMNYWRKEHESAALFDQRCEANAVNLEVYCRTKANGSYEGDYDRQTVIARLKALFMDGRKTLAVMGAAVDAIFLFPTEVE